MMADVKLLSALRTPRKNGESDENTQISIASVEPSFQTREGALKSLNLTPKAVTQRSSKPQEFTPLLKTVQKNSQKKSNLGKEVTFSPLQEIHDIHQSQSTMNLDPVNSSLLSQSSENISTKETKYDNLTLIDQRDQYHKLTKENFAFRLKIHFLEEKLSSKYDNDSSMLQGIDQQVEKVKLLNELKNYRKYLSKAEAELARISEEHQKLKNEKQPDNEIVQPNIEVEELVTQLHEYEELLKAAEYKNESLVTQIAQVTEKLESNSTGQQIQDLKAELQDKSAELDEYREKLNDQIDQNAALEAENQQLVKRLSIAESDGLGDIKKQIEELESKELEYQKKISESKENYERIVEENNYLKNEFAEFKNSKDLSLESFRTRAEEAEKALKIALQNHKHDKADLLESLDVAEKALDNQDSHEKAKLESELKFLQKKYDSISKQANISFDNVYFEDQIVKLEKLIGNIRIREEVTLQEKEHLLDALTSIEEQLDKCDPRIRQELQSDKFKNLKQAINSLVSGENLTKSLIDKISMSLNTLNDFIVANYSNLKEELDEEKRESKNLRHRIQTLTHQNNKVTEEKTQIKKRLEQLQRDHSIVEMRLHSLERKSSENGSETIDNGNLIREELETIKSRHAKLTSIFEHIKRKLYGSNWSSYKDDDVTEELQKILNDLAEERAEKHNKESAAAKNSYFQSENSLHQIHQAELRGLTKQIKYLRAKCDKERTYRADLTFGKKFFMRQIELYEKCNQLNLAMIEEMGIYPDFRIRRRRKSLKSVVYGIIAIIRMKRLSNQWFLHREAKEEIIKSVHQLKWRQMQPKA